MRTRTRSGSEATAAAALCGVRHQAGGPATSGLSMDAGPVRPNVDVSLFPHPRCQRRARPNATWSRQARSSTYSPRIPPDSRKTRAELARRAEEASDSRLLPRALVHLCSHSRSPLSSSSRRLKRSRLLSSGVSAHLVSRAASKRSPFLVACRRPVRRAREIVTCRRVPCRHLRKRTR
jgi:hypothetical protein